MSDEDSVARSILAAIGHANATLAPLGIGLSSRAWRVDLDGVAAVLRVGLPGARGQSTYEMEHAVMARVADEGVPVPRPIVGHWDLPDWGGAPFSATSLVPGFSHDVDSWEGVIPALGPIVRAVAAVSMRGFGPLVVRGGELRGSEEDASAGLRSWASRPLWPLEDVDLRDHEQVRPNPDLARRLIANTTGVLGAIVAGPFGLVHADLHEENILDDEGRLTLIDFGGALVGPLAWEYASFAYFAGWQAGDALLDASVDGANTAAMREQASALGLAFGVYRWRWERVRESHEDDYHATFLESTLTRLAGSTSA